MSTALRRALFAALNGDTGSGGLRNMLPAAPYTNSVGGTIGGIYHNQAPQEASFPLVIFSKSSGIPTEAFGTYGTAVPRFAYETEIWMVKAIAEGPTADAAEKIAARMNRVLNDNPMTLTGGGTALYARRENDLEYTEPVEGSEQLYHHIGATYRIIYESLLPA